MIWILAYLISGLAFLARDVLNKKLIVDDPIVFGIIFIIYLFGGGIMMFKELGKFVVSTFYKLYKWCRNEWNERSNDIYNEYIL